MKKYLWILLLLPIFILGMWEGVRKEELNTWVTSFRVKAYNSSIKDFNIPCTGENDNLKINPLIGSDRKIILSDGVFNIDCDIRVHDIQNLMVCGQGEGTIIRFADDVSSLLTADAAVGDTFVIVADASGFRAGTEITVDDDNTNPPEIFCIASISGDTIFLTTSAYITTYTDTLASAMTTAENAVVHNTMNGFLLTGTTNNCTFMDFCIQGNKDNRVTKITDANVNENGVLLWEYPRNCIFKRIRVDSTEGGGIHLARAHTITMRDCKSNECRGMGFYLCENNDSCKIVNCWVWNTIIGISTGGQTHGCLVDGCHLYNCQYGVKLYDGYLINITNNDFWNCTNYGVNVTDTVRYVNIHNNTFWGVARHGVLVQTGVKHVKIHDNQMYHCGWSSEPNSIEIQGTVDDVWIESNMIDCATNGDTAILISSAATNIHVIGNDILNCDGVNDIGVGYYCSPDEIEIRNNTGFITEAHGQDTIPDDATNVEITHGLSETPTDYVFTITPLIWGDATKVSLPPDSIEADVFDFEIDGDPGATGFIFRWSARREP